MLTAAALINASGSTNDTNVAPPEKTPLIQVRAKKENVTPKEKTSQRSKSDISSQKRCVPTTTINDNDGHHHHHYKESLPKRRRIAKGEEEENINSGNNLLTSEMDIRNDTNVILAYENVENENVDVRNGKNESENVNFNDQITFSETNDGYENDVIQKETNDLGEQKNINEQGAEEKESVNNNDNDLLTSEMSIRNDTNVILTYEEDANVSNDTNKSENVSFNDQITFSETNDGYENDVIQKEKNDLGEQKNINEQGAEEEEEEEEIDINALRLAEVNKIRNNVFSAIESEKDDTKKLILREIYSIYDQYETLLTKEMRFSDKEVAQYKRFIKSKHRKEVVEYIQNYLRTNFPMYGIPSHPDGESLNKIFYITMTFLDRFLFFMRDEMTIEDLQFSIFVCLFIACKVENSFITDCVKEVLLDMKDVMAVTNAELLVLYKLGFGLSVVTPMEFLRLISYCDEDVEGQLVSASSPLYSRKDWHDVLLKPLKDENGGGGGDNENVDNKKEENNNDSKEEENNGKVPVEDVFNLAVGFCNDMIKSYGYLKEPPSRIAFIAWYEARKAYGLPGWSDSLKKILIHDEIH